MITSVTWEVHSSYPPPPDTGPLSLQEEEGLNIQSSVPALVFLMTNNIL